MLLAELTDDLPNDPRDPHQSTTERDVRPAGTLP